jgi:hypothetical protein
VPFQNRAFSAACEVVPCYKAGFETACRLALFAFGQGQGLSFRNIIPVPPGNLDDIVAWPRDDCLAAKARIQLLVGSHVEPVKLIVVGVADALLILDPKVAGGASANASTGVVEKDVEILGYVEKRHGLAVVIVGHGAEFKLHCVARGHKGYSHQLIRRDFALRNFTHD